MSEQVATLSEAGPVSYVTGDLFAARKFVDAIAHGVNCRGVMGKGIAPLFKQRYPQMYDVYRQACLAEAGDGTPSLSVGGFLPWQAEPVTPGKDGLWIYNLATQDRPGRDARLDAIASSLTLALDHAAAHGVTSIAMPRLGAGIGGLGWTQVRQVIEETVNQRDDTAVRVVVVSLPGADR